MSTRQSDLKVAVGDTVKIIEGAFSGLEGQVAEVDEERQKLKVRYRYVWSGNQCRTRF